MHQLRNKINRDYRGKREKLGVRVHKMLRHQQNLLLYRKGRVELQDYRSAKAEQSDMKIDRT